MKKGPQRGDLAIHRCGAQMRRLRAVENPRPRMLRRRTTRIVDTLRRTQPVEKRLRIATVVPHGERRQTTFGLDMTDESIKHTAKIIEKSFGFSVSPYFSAAKSNFASSGSGAFAGSRRPVAAARTAFGEPYGPQKAFARVSPPPIDTKPAPEIAASCRNSESREFRSRPPTRDLVTIAWGCGYSG